MSHAQDRSTLVRLSKELTGLKAKEAAEAKKVADAQKKMNSALGSARRASSPSSAKMYLGTVDRETKNIESAQDKQARYATSAASKSQEIGRLQERIMREEERERKREQAASQKKEREADIRRRATEAASEDYTRATQERIQALEAQVSQFLEAEATRGDRFIPQPPQGETEAYDVFISHASEDKDDFVRELADKVRAAGLRVWYDEFSMAWGDSLRQKIDQGLRGSYFGVAVLSPNFFAKQWTSYELDALVERTLSGQGRLLPIWHRVSKDEVLAQSPSLANRLALNTSLLSTEDIVRELVKLTKIYRSGVSACPDAP